MNSYERGARFKPSDRSSSQKRTSRVAIHQLPDPLHPTAMGVAKSWLDELPGAGQLAESVSSLYTTRFHSSEPYFRSFISAKSRGCMGSLRCGWCAAIAVSFLLLILPACGGHKPAGASPFPVSISLNPSPSTSLQLGSVLQFTANAVNNGNSHISPTFTYTVISSGSPNTTNPNGNSGGILDIAPGGVACAGNWNAPLYTICTPGNVGAVEVTASALGASSAPTWVFVHAPIASISIQVVPPVNSPPVACPNQIALPAACDLKFNPVNACLSTNQTETLQAVALDSSGNDITQSVGPFNWTATNPTVANFAPILNPSFNVATNQVTVTPGAPGQTQIVASASGVFSQPTQPTTPGPIPSTFETCPVQCIDLELTTNGEFTGQTSFVTTKGTSETVTATAVDVQGCIVPKPPLTWSSSQPASVSAGGAAGCTGSTCSISTSQAGAGVVTASCTPPTCNVGFPLNLNPALGAPFIPQPVYPITGISGLVTGTPVTTNVIATSQDCYSNQICGVALYYVSSTTNSAGSPTTLPTAPNSLLFDLPGDKAYMGSEFGALAINPADFGTSSNPFTPLPAPGTPLGLVTGKVIAISRNGSQAIFSDTVSTPNKVYVVTTAAGSATGSTAASTTQLDINAAIAAAFSPDGLKAFILGDGGTSLYVYSPLQALREIASPLPTPATAIAFNSTGSFALLAGGGTATNLAVYNTCDNSSPTLSAGSLTTPPILLKMIPPGNVTLSTALLPSPLETAGLDFFIGVDNTGIDLIATTSSLLPLPVPPGPLTLTTLCPRSIALAQIQLTSASFEPVHINIGHGTFNPINFFVSPDATQVYIVTSDQGVLTYSFNTGGAALSIPLSNNAAPLAADMTADGTLIYVAGSDGLLHQLVTQTASEQESPISFPALPNSANSFCYSSYSCALDIVAVRP
jgi:hypothetical protein